MVTQLNQRLMSRGQFVRQDAGLQREARYYAALFALSGNSSPGSGTDPAIARAIATKLDIAAPVEVERHELAVSAPLPAAGVPAASRVGVGAVTSKDRLYVVIVHVKDQTPSALPGWQLPSAAVTSGLQELLASRWAAPVVQLLAIRTFERALARSMATGPRPLAANR